MPTPLLSFRPFSSPTTSSAPRARPLALALTLALGVAASAGHADPLPEDMAATAEKLDAGVQEIKNEVLAIDASGIALEESVRQPVWQRATFYIGVTQGDFVLESARLIVDGAEVVATREFSQKEANSLNRRALFKLTTAAVPLGPHSLRLEYVGHRRAGAIKNDSAIGRLFRLPTFSLFGLSREDQREVDRELTGQSRAGTDTQRYPAASTRGAQPLIQGTVDGVFEKTAEQVDLEISLGWDQRENRVGGNVIVWRPGK